MRHFLFEVETFLFEVGILRVKTGMVLLEVRSFRSQIGTVIFTVRTLLFEVRSFLLEVRTIAVAAQAMLFEVGMIPVVGIADVLRMRCVVQTAGMIVVASWFLPLWRLEVAATETKPAAAGSGMHYLGESATADFVLVVAVLIARYLSVIL